MYLKQIVSQTVWLSSYMKEKLLFDEAFNLYPVAFRLKNLVEIDSKTLKFWPFSQKCWHSIMRQFAVV